VNCCTVFDLASYKISAHVDFWCCISDIFSNFRADFMTVIFQLNKFHAQLSFPYVVIIAYHIPYQIG
jgi:hypothetical protein